jgi:hypothetical protein
VGYCWAVRLLLLLGCGGLALLGLIAGWVERRKKGGKKKKHFAIFQRRSNK